MTEPVSIFISYSWDSEAHKEWVLGFATKLHDDGFAVILDRWDADLGDDLTLFMEKSVKEASRVLIICTEEYVRKAEAGLGGVGYERLIVTGELVRNIGTNKFIPVIRQGTGEHLTPSFLATRRYIDFRDDSAFETNITELADSLKKTVTPSKPLRIELALSPVSIPPSALGDATPYELASQALQQENLLQWRNLAKQYKARFKAQIAEWRSRREVSPSKSLEEVLACADESIEAAAPIIALALAGIESSDKRFSDQRALFDELANPLNWQRGGYVRLVAMPEALGFAYHCLHGTLCVQTGQAQLALDLAVMPVPVPGNSEAPHKPLYLISSYMGWTKRLGEKVVVAWIWIFDAYKRWKWLAPIFGSEEDYQIALIAYFMILNFYEFSRAVADRVQLVPGQMFMRVPLCFLDADRSLCQKAYQLLSQNTDLLENILRQSNVSRSEAVEAWKAWIAVCDKWGGNAFWRLHDNPMANLLANEAAHA